MCSVPSCSAYEHLPDTKKNDLICFLLSHLERKVEGGGAGVEALISGIVKRRISTGESLELVDVVNEGVALLEASLDEKFREDLFRKVLTVIT